MNETQAQAIHASVANATVKRMEGGLLGEAVGSVWAAYRDAELSFTVSGACFRQRLIRNLVPFSSIQNRFSSPAD